MPDRRAGHQSQKHFWDSRESQKRCGGPKNGARRFLPGRAGRRAENRREQARKSGMSTVHLGAKMQRNGERIPSDRCAAHRPPRLRRNRRRAGRRRRCLSCSRPAATMRSMDGVVAWFISGLAFLLLVMGGYGGGCGGGGGGARRGCGSGGGRERRHSSSTS